MSSSGTTTAKEVFELLRDDLAAIEREFGRDTVSSVRAITDIGEHLRALARVSRLLRDSTICQKLRGTDNADALYALLTDRTESHAA